ncbi:Olfactory receptor 5D13 [Sciurus carolinensis]|uniref:Olfactory receptor 5D13 n=1 Tax=Sciurus carolinensis TaxID=30640 RepID=A0AA41T2P1_SCICA|nr:Olfactory receptor 5D13 [Sciurus carolinensis]
MSPIRRRKNKKYWIPYQPNQTDENGLVFKMRRLRLTQSSATRNSDLPTWGQVKRLTAAAEHMVNSSGKPKTPEALFFALIALISTQVLPIHAYDSEGKAYWIYFLNPPLLHPTTWSRTNIKVFTNEPQLLGGISDSLILHKIAFTITFHGITKETPMCFSTDNLHVPLGLHAPYRTNNPRKQTAGVKFILLGFSEYPELQVPLFLFFLTIYIVTVLGNTGMILVIRVNPKLHTPMYFFLSHLSFIDFCYSTVVTPKLLENLVVEDRTISFPGCILQFFFACICVVTETFMLAVMAYDRFVAVCNPLLYMVAMSQKLYSYINQKIILVSATLNEISSLVIILASYVLIYITIMKMPSGGGRHKAFSTCASHLTAITIFHGTILFLYCVPITKSSWLMVKIASIFYTVVIPMLNPLIYSLRNKDVKETVRKLINTKLHHIL